MVFIEQKSIQFNAKYISTDNEEIGIIKFGLAGDPSMEKVITHNNVRVYHNRPFGVTVKTYYKERSYCTLEMFADKESREKVKKDLTQIFDFKFKDKEENGE